jgi:hypothetical protein
VYLLTLKRKKEKEIPLLGKVVPCSWWRIPILSGPLLEVNCLAPLALPSPPHAPPPHPLPTKRTFIYMQMTLTCPLLLSGTVTKCSQKELKIYKNGF